MKIIIKFIIICVFLSCLSCSVYAFDFTSQEIVDGSFTHIDTWSDNKGVFFGFSTDAYKTIQIKSSATVTIASITLESDISENRRLKAVNNNRFLNFTAENSSVTLKNITFREGSYDGNDTEGGGALRHIGTGILYLDGDFAFEYNKTSVYGGAIYSSGSVTVSGNAEFKNNISGGNYGGGAIYAAGDILFSSGSQANFSLNEGGAGGALFSLNGSVIFNGGTVMEGNIAVGANIEDTDNTYLYGAGGAIYSSGSIQFASEIDTVVISSNASSGLGHGGALFAGSSVSFAGGVLIEKNHAQQGSGGNTYNGGAIYASEDVVFLSSSGDVKISSNYASGSGGAVFSSGSIVFTGEAKIIGNYSVSGSGGALWAKDNISISTALTFTVVEISSNQAYESGFGGALFSETGIVSIEGYLIARGNTANSGGFVYAPHIDINGGEILNNVALSSGGAIYIFGDAFTNYASQISALNSNVLFSGNTAGDVRNDIFMDASNNDVTLRLNAASRSYSITFDGGIKSSTGSASTSTVYKEGAGNLILNGDNYIGNFKVNEGTVTFGASSSFIADTVDIDKSFIDFRNLNASDELQVNSTFISTRGATVYLDIDSDSGRSDVIISSSAQLDGTFIKIGLSGVDASSQTYTIVSLQNSGTGQIQIDKTNGDFDNINGTSAMTRVNVIVLYDSLAENYNSNWKRIDLEIKIDQLNVLPGLTDNQLQNALVLDRDYGTAKGDLFYIIDTIDRMSGVEQKKNALNDLSAHIYANVITLPALNWSKNNIFPRLDKGYFSFSEELLKRNAWVQGFVSSDKYEGDVNSPGDFKADTSGFQTGFDTMKNDRQIFGITAGYSDTGVSQNADKIDMTAYNIGGYGAYFFDNAFDVKFMFIGARQNYDSKRQVRYLQRTAQSDFTGLSLNSSVLGSYDWYYKNGIYFKPSAGFDFSFVSRQEFTETGAESADLKIYSGSYSRLNALIGFEANNGYEGNFKWHCGINFNFLVSGSRSSFEGEYKNTKRSFEIVGIENGILNISFGGGALYDISEKISVYANANAAFLGNQTSYYANFGVSYKFSTQNSDFFDR
ncbi:MAG: autotransporter domain-containing protein [Endomicrobium sp.]|jgi:autotransporter-associated beta strand protein/predicted outer membrane repeat protein|nr:autotransporter domain-containing protein [Endomicrobium sp.]